MNREELLLETANLFEKAKKIEKRANPNYDEEYEQAMKDADKFIFDAFYLMSLALYGGQINDRIN